MEVSGFTPRPFYPQERAPGTGRQGGPQSRYGRGGEEKNSQPMPGLEPLIIHQLIVVFLKHSSLLGVTGTVESLK
jgi:hypothetical protein